MKIEFKKYQNINPSKITRIYNPENKEVARAIMAEATKLPDGVWMPVVDGATVIVDYKNLKMLPACVNKTDKGLLLGRSDSGAGALTKNWIERVCPKRGALIYYGGGNACENPLYLRTNSEQF